MILDFFNDAEQRYDQIAAVKRQTEEDQANQRDLLMAEGSSQISSVRSIFEGVGDWGEFVPPIS